MGMDKRDITLAQCGVYLLAWLIRDALEERYKHMKAALATIHRQLDVEDEATSEPAPEPKWRHLFPTEDCGPVIPGRRCPAWVHREGTCKKP